MEDPFILHWLLQYPPGVLKASTAAVWKAAVYWLHPLVSYFIRSIEDRQNYGSLLRHHVPIIPIPLDDQPWTFQP